MLAGAGRDGQRRVDQPGDDEQSSEDHPPHPTPANETCQRVGPGDGPHHPGLEVELEDGIHAVAKVIAQVDELDGEGEEGAGGEKKKNKVGWFVGWLVCWLVGLLVGAEEEGDGDQEGDEAEGDPGSEQTQEQVVRDEGARVGQVQAGDRAAA